MFRKRTYAQASSSWGAKKRRSTFKKRRKTSYRRKSRGVNQTSKATHGSSLPFRSRRLSKKAFKRILWRDSILSPHYRTLQSLASTITTPASNVVVQTSAYTPLFLGGNSFWTGAGGIRSLDIGVTPPLFQGHITLRGGMWGMIMRNTSSTLPVAIKVYIGTTVALPSYTLPATSNIGWDPSMEPDLSENLAKFHYNTTVQLEPNETFKLERRVSIKKIDMTVWNNSGYMPYVILIAYNVGHSTAVAINVTTYYNMSLSGDAIGTT